MRNIVLMTVGALALAVSTAGAQQAALAASSSELTGRVDFGFRGDSNSGDAARFERYRDLRQGAASQVVFGKDTDRYLFAGQLQNIGYRDQRYAASYNGGKTVLSG